MAIARSTDWTMSPAAPSSSIDRRTAFAGPRSGPFLIASDLPRRAARLFLGGMLNQGVAPRHASGPDLSPDRARGHRRTRLQALRRRRRGAERRWPRAFSSPLFPARRG